MNFTAAMDFADLCAANLRYLRGDVPCTPFILAPLDLETGPLLADLEALHTRRRVFTFESQPGLERVEWVERSVYADGCCSWSVHVETHQRAYVDTWIEADALPALLERLRACAVDLCFLADVPGRPDLFRHNVPEADCWAAADGTRLLNLTRTRSAPSTADLTAAPWDHDTNAWLCAGWADAELAGLAVHHPNVAHVLSGCVLVAAMSRRYGCGEGWVTPLGALLADS